MLLQAWLPYRQVIAAEGARARPIVATLLRKLGSRDAALIVMGGIIGSGIFMNPSVVARYLPNAPLAMLAWTIGGLIALLGAFLFAELAARNPSNGGLYAYMRDAFHPSLAFVYGWTLLLVSQSGGAAAAAITFAAYFEPLTGVHAPFWLVAVIVIALFTSINALGVLVGTRTQNAFMIAKIIAIVALILAGAIAPHAAAAGATLPAFAGGNPLAAMGLALVPVLFAYNGWQTSSFMSGELHEPRRTLPRGMIFGVLGVIVLYLAVNLVSLRALGIAGLAATHTPASQIAQLVFGPLGARMMAGIIAISTLGFLSNQILTAPRVYFQMAADGLFFKPLAWIHPRTHVPTLAIALQGGFAIVIALSGKYDAILNYVTSVDYVFFGLAAIALFIFRARDARSGGKAIPGARMPFYPWSTALFLVVAWAMVGDVLVKAPRDTLLGLGILASGLPVYALFRATRR